MYHLKALSNIAWRFPAAKKAILTQHRRRKLEQEAKDRDFTLPRVDYENMVIIF